VRRFFWRGFRAPPLAHSQAGRWVRVAHRGRCATRYGRPSVAYVTPSRRATRTALLNSSSARTCHLDVATLRRFSPATRGGGGRGGLLVGADAPRAVLK